MSVLPRLTAPARREAILEAAVKLFAERGFRGVTTRELASAVGVTEPVLYQHFPSKRDMYRALIEHKMEQMRGMNERFQALCAAPVSVEEFLNELALLAVDWHAADPSFLRLLMFSSLEGHELKEMFHEQMMTCYFRVLVDTLGRFIKQGELRDIDPELAAYAFKSLISQHCLDRHLFRHPLGERPNEVVVRTMVDVFINGLKKENR